MDTSSEVWSQGGGKPPRAARVPEWHAPKHPGGSVCLGFSSGPLPWALGGFRWDFFYGPLFFSWYILSIYGFQIGGACEGPMVWTVESSVVQKLAT